VDVTHHFPGYKQTFTVKLLTIISTALGSLLLIVVHCKAFTIKVCALGQDRKIGLLHFRNFIDK
jgi:hypothetical protein